MMTFLDDERPKKPTSHEIGCDLSAMSAEELERRITLLEEEISRLQAERGRKDAGRRAAEDLFKR